MEKTNQLDDISTFGYFAPPLLHILRIFIRVPSALVLWVKLIVIPPSFVRTTTTSLVSSVSHLFCYPASPTGCLKKLDTFGSHSGISLQTRVPKTPCTTSFSLLRLFSPPNPAMVLRSVSVPKD